VRVDGDRVIFRLSADLALGYVLQQI